MKLLFPALLWVFVFPVDDDNKLKCQEFRTGTFRLVDDKIDKRYLIQRDESMQVETDLASKSITKFRVTWISECEYELTIAEGDEAIMKFYAGKILSVRMLETFDNSYKFEAQLKGLDAPVVIHTLERVD